MANTDFNALPSLKHLRIEECGITAKWLSMILQHAPALEELNLESCQQFTVLVIEGKESGLSNHTSLEKIIIARCDELTFQGNKEGFSVFTSLEELTIEQCPELIPSLVYKYENSDQANGRWLLPCSLSELSVNGGFNIEGSIKTLQPCFLEGRNYLKKLKICNNPSLESLQLRSCTALEELVVGDCQSLAALEGNTCLKKLELSSNERLKSLELGSFTVLEEIMIQNCESLTIMLEGNFTCLKKLKLSYNNRNSGLESLKLGSCTALKEMMIKNCESLTALEGNFTCLKKLVLCGTSRLESLQLSSCTALEGLTIRSCASLAALEGNFTCLRKLGLWHNPRLKSVQLRFCAALEDLEIHDCESLDVLEDFQYLRGLRYLDVSSCPALTPYLEHLLNQGYELCAGLERLRTDDYSFLTMSFCKCLTSLQRLELCDFTRKVTRLTDEQERALQLLTSVQELEFENHSSLTDLPVGLHSLHSLKKLEIIYCPRISGLPEKGLPYSLEELDIIYLSEDRHKKLIDQCRTLATSKLKVKINWEYVN